MDPNTHILIIDDVAENIQVAMKVMKEDGFNIAAIKQALNAFPELISQLKSLIK